jgi:hypothetical protein
VAKTERISVYFDPKKHGNLKDYISRLSADSSSQYYSRSESEIARMLLQERFNELKAAIDERQT